MFTIFAIFKLPFKNKKIRFAWKRIYLIQTYLFLESVAAKAARRA